MPSTTAAPLTVPPVDGGSVTEGDGRPVGRSGERSGSVGRQTAPCTRRRVRAARYDRLGLASRTNSIDRPTSSIILLVFARLAIEAAVEVVLVRRSDGVP